VSRKHVALTIVLQLQIVSGTYAVSSFATDCDPPGVLVINTGWDQQNGTVSSGADEEWRVVSDGDPNTVEPRPAQLIPTFAGWVPPQPNSSWVSPYPTLDAYEVGTFGFEYRFCLDNTTGASLDLVLRADNNTNVYLNGNLIGSGGGFLPSQQPVAMSTSNPSFFLAGENVLLVELENSDYVMGLNIVGSIQGSVPQYRYCCLNETGTLTGVVFHDLNQNGVRDQYEPGLEDWTVQVGTSTATSDEYGSYFFFDLAPGVFTVTEVGQSGWTQSSGPYTVTLDAGQVLGGLDFGNYGPEDPPCDKPVRMEQYDRQPACSVPGDTTVLYSTTFKSGSNCTVDGWTSVDLSGRGDLAALHAGNNLLQEELCFPGLSCAWAFITGSTEVYDCNSPPSSGQPVVPHQDAMDRYVFNEIWSPEIPLNGGCQNLNLRFSVYRDLSFSGLVFYEWHIRSRVDGNWGPWRDRNLVYYGNQKDWLEHLEALGPLVDAGATSVQISLGVRDMCESWCNVIGDGACHSHSPLFGNVKLFRVSTNAPQWSIRDIDQFQDNFPADGTITGCVRADIAEDALLPMDIGIMPGDAAVVTVDDCSSGIDTTNTGWNGPAVYIYVRVRNGALPDKGGPSVSDNHIQFPWLGQVNVGGVFWDRIGMGYTCVPGTYFVDLNDCYFTPCDTVNFFYGATNNNGVTSYAYGKRLECQGTSLAAAAAGAAEFTCLPTLCCSGNGGDILYVNGMSGRGTQPYFDSAFKILGLQGKVDRFDVRGPSSAVGNRLGSRVVVAEQLVSCYRKIIWDCGDLEVTLGDGMGMPEKSGDYQVLNEFLAYLPGPGGVYLCGDDVATNLFYSQDASAATFKSTYIPFTLDKSNHRQAGFSISPTLVHWPTRAFSDDVIAFGGCPLVNDFDVMIPTGGSQTQMSYATSQGSSAAIISNVTGNAGVMISGISLAYLRDNDTDGTSDRAKHLYDVITWLGNVVNEPTATGPVRRYELSQNYPNPFNPTTMISFSIKNRTRISLRVYAVDGALVRTLLDEVRDAGSYSIEWDGRGNDGTAMSSGVYFYKMMAGDFSRTRKMVLLK